MTDKIEQLIQIAQSDQPDEDKKRQIEAVDPNHIYSPKALKVVDGEIGQINREVAALETKKSYVAMDVARQRKLVNSLEAYRAWEEYETAQYRLEKNDCSRLHKLRESLLQGLFYDAALKGFVDPKSQHARAADNAQVFVVCHDWAAAFGDNLKDDDEYRLPYDFCAFEFRVSGHTVMLLVKSVGAHIELSSCIEGVEGVWMSLGYEAMQEINTFLLRQVRAICIALGAEVAQHQKVSAPAKLNAKRLKDGKPLLADFHVVDLSRRIRDRAKGQNVPYQGKVRLHWRRGHWRWRDDPDKRKWIEWMLCGNPDLGFIDKHYRI
jgi:hypothetical protein